MERLRLIVFFLGVLLAAPHGTAFAEEAEGVSAWMQAERGKKFGQEVQLALRPVGRLIAALRLRMERGEDLDKAEPLLRKTAEMMQAHLVYAGVVNPYGQIQLGSAPAHPDYGEKVIFRGPDLNASLTLKMLKFHKMETWMVHRPRHRGHYEMFVAPPFEGKYEDYLIYYCVNLEAVCRRAERAMALRDNEAYYLLSRGGNLIHHSIEEDIAKEDGLTKFEKEYVQQIQKEILARDSGVTSYVGFSRGHAEVVSHQISWEKIARSVQDDWVLVFEEKRPVPPQEDRLLLGSWVSTSPAMPLRIGMLQEGNAIYLRGDGMIGRFRGKGRYVKGQLGITSSFQEGKEHKTLDSFDASYLAERDVIEAVFHWSDSGRNFSSKVELKRVNKAEELAKMSVPLEFPDFPDPDAKLVVEPSE